MRRLWLVLVGVAASGLSLAACDRDGSSDPWDDASDGSTGMADPSMETGGSSHEGEEAAECDIWRQDCPEGEKCMPWESVPGASWDGVRYTPLDSNPQQPGDPCTVEGEPKSGVDDCGLGSMCWDVDDATKVGSRVPFCTGTAESPGCADPDDTCVITNEEALILCLPSCSPLFQDCADGYGCYPVNGTFACARDKSEDQGSFGTACEFINHCDPGLFCEAAEHVPGCRASAGCCTEFCDLTDPGGDGQCTGADQVCTDLISWPVVPGFENVGGCVLP